MPDFHKPIKSLIFQERSYKYMSNYKTKQRDSLINFLQQNPDRQFSAKVIADNLTSPKISISAVYRNLASLESAGLIRRFSREGSREIYYQYTKASQCMNCIHMICTKCGKTFHANIKTADRLRSDTLKNDGFCLNISKTVLYGLCCDCLSSCPR